MSSLCNVKKSVSVPESFSDTNCNELSDNIYYEEAWDIKMARLGIDIAKLNSIFTENLYSTDDNTDSSTMTRSCINPVDRQDPPLIRMTSSTIENNAIANNPVYSFKKYGSSPKNLSSSPIKHNPLHCAGYHDISSPFRADSEQTLDEITGSMATLRPQPSRGILLNNNCYEFAPSQLVNAIIDKDREISNSRIFSGATTSAFKPLSISKSRQNPSTSIYNNHFSLSGSQKPYSGYSRQISAPADSATEMVNKMSYHQEDLDKGSKTLQFKASRRFIKTANDNNPVNSPPPTNTWTLKPRFQIEHHVHESSRKSGKLMTKSMVSDESKLSDNYIKHLTGQEIAGNFIKHSQRPECHPQRTEDRYHMGFNDSRLDMIADSNRPLEEHLWYHPFLSRVESEQLLAKYPEGSFLVRRSESSSNEYSLSIRYKQKWLHMKISRDIDGQFVLGQYSQPYPSIPIMIRHYSCSFLPVKGANLISLQQPVFRL